MKRLQISLIGIVILSSLLVAQNDFMGMGHMDPARREQMESLRIWQMTDFLYLSSEQSEKFFPRFNEFENFIHENKEKQRDIMTKIYELGGDEDYTATEKDVKEFAQQLALLEKEIINKKEAFILSIGDVLTEDQQLKFIVFDNRFSNRLMRSMFQPQEGFQKGPRKERK